jgi:hypothetical protein
LVKITKRTSGFPGSSFGLRLLVVLLVFIGLRVLHVNFVGKLCSIIFLVRGIHVCRVFIFIIVVHTNDLPSR